MPREARARTGASEQSASSGPGAGSAQCDGSARPPRPARARLLAPLFIAVALLAVLHPVALDAQLFGSLSTDEEVELGQQAAAEIEKSVPLVADDQILAYLDGLGQAIVRRSDRPDLAYHFKLANQAAVNAFALPGGFVYINRGLVETADNESELAGVLSHEIAHVVARHGVDQMRRAQVSGIGIRVLGSVLGGGMRGRLGNVAAEMVANGAFMKFSRDAEREADRLGAETVAAEGHDPRGMVTFFEKLAALRERQPNAVERFFASHPSPAERVENIADLVASLTAGRRLRTDTAAFQVIKRRLVALPPAPAPTAAAAAPKADAAPASETAGPSDTPGRVRESDPDPQRDRAIAARFAPVFHQALGPDPRFDFVTNFDFDGDWRGDNNWQHAGDERYPLAAYVGYGVTETRTHLFVVYTVFHPRDYKGGTTRGVILSEVIREGAREGAAFDPTGLSQEAVLAHENDLEGCLIVAEKRGDRLDRARLVYVETLAHNAFLRYARRDRRGGVRLRTDGERAVLYIEPKGHGIEAYARQHLADDSTGWLIYRYAGRAEDPGTRHGREVGYDLVALFDTVWAQARGGEGETFGEVFTYPPWRINAVTADLDDIAHDVALEPLGAAFRGVTGGRNMARPPWAWFDDRERDRPLGEWFFDPAKTIRRHFEPPHPFSTSYVHHPFLGVRRPAEVH